MFICKNVIVNGRRTSIRFDQEAWQTLFDICQKEELSIHQLCSQIDLTKGDLGLSTAVRLFVLNYLRQQLNQYKSRQNI